MTNKKMVELLVLVLSITCLSIGTVYNDGGAILVGVLSLIAFYLHK